MLFLLFPSSAPCSSSCSAAYSTPLPCLPSCCSSPCSPLCTAACSSLLFSLPTSLLLLSLLLVLLLCTAPYTSPCTPPCNPPCSLGQGYLHTKSFLNSLPSSLALLLICTFSILLLFFWSSTRFLFFARLIPSCFRFLFLNSVYLACPLLSFFFFFLISYFFTFPSSSSFLPALLALFVFLLLSFAVCIFPPVSGFRSALFFLPQVRGNHGCCWLT